MSRGAWLRVGLEVERPEFQLGEVQRVRNLGYLCLLKPTEGLGL